MSTGFLAYSNLEEFNINGGNSTGITKPNNTSDPDYVAPVFNTDACPLPSSTPSPTPSNSPTPSTTPSATPSITPTPSTTPSVTPTPSISLSPTPTPSVTPSITPSPSTPSTPAVTFASGFITICEDGFEYLNWGVSINQPYNTDIDFTLKIDLYIDGSFANEIIINNTIPTGETSVGFSDCGRLSFLGIGYSTISCLQYIDSPIISTGFDC